MDGTRVYVVTRWHAWFDTETTDVVGVVADERKAKTFCDRHNAKVPSYELTRYSYESFTIGELE